VYTFLPNKGFNSVSLAFTTALTTSLSVYIIAQKITVSREICGAAAYILQVHYTEKYLDIVNKGSICWIPN
jgi:hypothetical protein